MIARLDAVGAQQRATWSRAAERLLMIPAPLWCCPVSYHSSRPLERSALLAAIRYLSEVPRAPAATAEQLP